MTGHSSIVWQLFVIAGLSFVQAQEPGSDSSMQVIAPVAKTVLHVGDTLIAKWVLHHNAKPQSGVAVSISPDEGATWLKLVAVTIPNNDTSYRDSVGTYRWIVRDSLLWYGSNYIHLESGTCQIKVYAPYDAVYAASYSDNFTIRPATGVRMRPAITDKSSFRHSIGVCPDIKAIGLNGQVLGSYRGEVFMKMSATMVKIIRENESVVRKIAFK